MSLNDILNQTQQLGKEIIPADGHLYLYGSRARGDFRSDSDWDLLILLNKEKEECSDFDTYSYPFIALGYDYGVSVSTHLYTMDKWDAMSFSPFYHNVEHDKIVVI
jgi:predicted nucleotidyltransferase